MYFRFGGQNSYDDKFKLLDVLNVKDVTFNELIWEFTSEQYGKYIINKVTFVCYKFNVDFRVDCDSQGRLDWCRTNEHYPFYHGVYYDKVDDAGKI